jgi:hypothetical protein
MEALQVASCGLRSLAGDRKFVSRLADARSLPSTEISILTKGKPGILQAAFRLHTPSMYCPGTYLRLTLPFRHNRTGSISCLGIVSEKEALVCSRLPFVHYSPVNERRLLK